MSLCCVERISSPEKISPALCISQTITLNLTATFPLLFKKLHHLYSFTVD